MQVGFVRQQSMVVQRGEDRQEVKYLEMHVKPVFGVAMRFTLSRNKSENAEAPAYNIYAQNEKGWIKRKMKVGALWMRRTDEGEDFMSGHIETPLVDGGKMNISLWKAKPLFENEEVDWLYDVSWKPYAPKKDDEKTTSTHAAPAVDVSSDDELPF